MFTLTRDLVTLEFSGLVDLNDLVRIICGFDPKTGQTGPLHGFWI